MLKQYLGNTREVKTPEQSKEQYDALCSVKMKCKWSRGRGTTKLKTFLKMVTYRIESGD
jgi:hypothetical protein